MKRLSLIVVLALAIAMLSAGAAYANFGPHGGYATDTDACAGCHRAHSSFSPIARTDYFDDTKAGVGSALLVSSATTMEDFCNACHGADAPGASTNVEEGIFDSGPSGADTVPIAGAILYQTSSSLNATLNAGGFESVGPSTGTMTSNHTMNSAAAASPMWGAGNSAVSVDAQVSGFTCTNCHDPHGSSNFRLLKDQVNGESVGGYLADGTPTPFVLSAEITYPQSGWYKGPAGKTQMDAYRPNYTTPTYRQGVAGKNMSVWCAACHTEYNVKSSAYDYAQYEQDTDSATQVGSKTRYRHAVNVSLLAGRDPQLTFANEVELNSALPLEQRYQKDPSVVNAKDFDDFIGCLTCHVAHGTDATMNGWANSELTYDAARTVAWVPQLRTTASPNQGVNPNFSSSLLRTDNRGVCERCHNK